jgi:hypothetical protein
MVNDLLFQDRKNARGCRTAWPAAGHSSRGDRYSVAEQNCPLSSQIDDQEDRPTWRNLRCPDELACLQMLHCRNDRAGADLDLLAKHGRSAGRYQSQEGNNYSHSRSRQLVLEWERRSEPLTVFSRADTPTGSDEIRVPKRCLAAPRDTAHCRGLPAAEAPRWVPAKATRLGISPWPDQS